MSWTAPDTYRPIGSYNRLVYDGPSQLTGDRIFVIATANNGNRKIGHMLQLWIVGYRRLITYNLPSESGASLKAAGYRVVHQTGGGSWDRPSRPRADKHPTGPKVLWEASA